MGSKRTYNDKHTIGYFVAGTVLILIGVSTSLILVSLIGGWLWALGGIGNRKPKGDQE